MGSTNSSDGVTFPGSIVSAEWLQAHLEDVQVVDASWFLPTMNRDAKAEHLSKRIPGAVFFELDAIADLSVPLPHMLPSNEMFAAAVDALGITNTTPVVVYDNFGLLSAARVWWSFKVFGHCQVAVLDGGRPQWEAKGYPLDAGAPKVDANAGGEAAKNAQTSPGSVKYRASLNTGAVRSFDQMVANCEGGSEQVVDARPNARFNGTAPEPRPGIPSGHISASLNVPFVALMEGGVFKSPEQLKAVFEDAGLDLTDGSKPVIASCGTGVTACILALGLDQIGVTKVSVYDGSWTEWAGAKEAETAKWRE